MNDDDKNCIKEAGKNIAAMAIRIKRERSLSPKEAVEMVLFELQREVCSAITEHFEPSN